jgi:hypothetical protein
MLSLRPFLNLIDHQKHSYREHIRTIAGMHEDDVEKAYGHFFNNHNQQRHHPCCEVKADPEKKAKRKASYKARCRNRK